MNHSFKLHADTFVYKCAEMFPNAFVLLALATSFLAQVWELDKSSCEEIF